MTYRVEDYYRVLGVPSDAALEQLKPAHRRKALLYHPDRNNGCRDAEQRFKECAEAYAVLSDPKRRATYDAQQLAPRDVAGWVHAIGTAIGARQRARRDGLDRHEIVTLTLDQAARGYTRDLQVTQEKLCASCNGHGGAAGKEKTCDMCKGTGIPRALAMLASGTFFCPACGGRGSRPVGVCRDCDGVGMKTQQAAVSISFRPGVRNGKRLVFDGLGEPGLRGGRDGVLYVTARILEHAFWVRDGDDLKMELPLSMHDAVLGGTVDVPVLDSVVKMRVPAGTQSGTVFRLANRGMPGRSGRGHMLVRVTVEVPTALNATQQALFAQFSDSLDATSNPLVETFISKMACFDE